MRIDKIYRKYKSQLREYISKYIPSGDVADDMTQDVFYKFIIADRDDPINAVSSWLYRVAQNQIIDYSRKHKEERMPLIAKSDDDEFLVSLADLLLTDDSTPENELFRSMIRDELSSALKELPEEQRIAFELTELQGLSFKDISESSGIAINTLISRKRYAILHLRERLSSLYQDIGLL